MSPEAWQAILAAELAPKKARVLLPGLAASDRPYEFLRTRPELSESERARVAGAVQARLAEAFGMGVRLLTPEEFPEPLRESPIAPPALFAWGNTECLQAPCIGIVGTRSATAYGRAVAKKFAEAFARAGVTVVSGGAIGIDSAAHKGALSASGATVSVMPCAVDQAYPAINAALFREIRERGCLVSQFAIGTKAQDHRFLARNGIVASLSRAVLVVEAPARSGALNTANTAAEIGRQVFVVPSTIDQLNFAGSHHLIREGATLVDHPDQVLEAIQIQPRLSLESKIESTGRAGRILAELSMEPLSEEKLAERTGLSTSDILSELTLLELEGLAIRGPGGFTKTL